MTDSFLFRLLFRGEEMHRKTSWSMAVVALGGSVIGTIRPGAPWEHFVVKLALAAAIMVVGLRLHPGAERIASDWQKYTESDS